MKKLLVTVIAGAMLLLAACGQKEKNVEGTLPEIMAKVYAGTENDMPPSLAQMEVTDENKAYYFGTDDIEFKEALASEPMISSIAHSVVLVRLNEDQDAEEVKKTIKENVNPAKWVCVQVEEQNVHVESKGDLVILIMDNIKPDKLLENFKAL